jgi:hypothetical protein
VAATDALCRSFLDLWWHFDPGDTLAGRLADFGPEAIREHVAALRAIAGAAEELEVEDAADEIDRTALLDHLRVLLFRFEHEHPYRANPVLWSDHLVRAFTPPEGEESEARVAAAALERLRDLPRFCRAAQEAIRTPPPVMTDAALEQLEFAGGAIEAACSRFRETWVRSGVEVDPLARGARTALRQLRVALAGAVAPDPDPHAGSIGEAEVDRRLHYEHASIHNAGEVWRGTLRLVTEVEQEVAAAAAAINPARPWRDVYLDAAGAALRPEDRAAAFSRWVSRSGEFALAHQFGEGALGPLAVSSLDERATPWTRWVAYRDPGPGPARLGLGAIPAQAIPWIAVRFGDPGMHRLASVRERLPGLVRRHIAASSTTGGWGLYAQELLAELGFQSEPESGLIERVLFLRDVHLALVDIGFHTRQLTLEDAIGHLAGRLPFERDIALADVRRILTEPLAACAALLGRHELRRLRADAQTAQGAGFTLAGFHEALGQHGGLPVPLIRWGMGLDA